LPPKTVENPEKLGEPSTDRPLLNEISVNSLRYFVRITFASLRFTNAAKNVALFPNAEHPLIALVLYQ
jgi:hypothetical protein